MTGYQSGFGNNFSTEALPGALPVGQNSPQKTPFGLYAEQLSGTAFTAPRAENRRSWVYRLRPSAMHAPYRPWDGNPLWSVVTEPTPNRLRWSPFGFEAGTDFIGGLRTICASGSADAQTGIGIAIYSADRSMQSVFFNADGEMVIVPQTGDLSVFTEMGRIEAGPQHIILIPRGIRFRVDVSGPSGGYVLENYGQPFRLPDLGPVGSNGLANPRDFEAPLAAFEDRRETVQLIQKYQGRLWSTELNHSPLDVGGWHGNLTPYRYDLRRFNTMNTVSYDHADPSIFTVLTSPSEVPGTANCDLVVFPPRWSVAEHTFRPPWFHRNVMSEFMGLIEGAYDAKADGFAAGGASLHPQMSAHGPDRATWEKATTAELRPEYISGGTAFMFESRLALHPTKWALENPSLQGDYDTCWNGFDKTEL